MHCPHFPVSLGSFPGAACQTPSAVLSGLAAAAAAALSGHQWAQSRSALAAQLAEQLLLMVLEAQAPLAEGREQASEGLLRTAFFGCGRVAGALVCLYHIQPRCCQVRHLGEQPAMRVWWHALCSGVAVHVDHV